MEEQTFEESETLADLAGCKLLAKKQGIDLKKVWKFKSNSLVVKKQMVKP